MAALGARLHWHGALSVDYLFDPETRRPAYIDANPRIGETFNATRSGVNIAELLVAVALDRTIAHAVLSQPGVRTHSVVMSLMGAAQRGESRAQLLAECCRALMHEAPYTRSDDEITRPGDDLPSLVPAAYLLMHMILVPRIASRIVTR